MKRSLSIFTVLLILLIWAISACSLRAGHKPIRVGILHSLSGTMSISESSVVDATKLAIDEINSNGGVLGRQIEMVIVDGRSDAKMFADAAEQLIKQEQVSVIFGCWTSASRRTVKPVIEKYNHLLFYPLQYEGLEQSPNIVYTGAAPNQQIIPAIKWGFDNLGKRFFLVGSDYVFPRTANEIIKAQLLALGAEVVGEEYVLLGGKDFAGIVEKIVQTQPTVILNTINGDSNVAFFHQLRAAGIMPEKIPTLSFSIAEDELRSLSAENMVGNYAAWNYFQSFDSEKNRKFVRRFKEIYGQDRVTDDPIEAGYFGVYLWAQAVEDAGTDNVNEVRENIKRQSLEAPGGIVYVDPESQHTWKVVRIGKINSNRQFDIVWSSEKPIRPVPYPVYRPKEQWDNFLANLYQGWGNNWAKQN